MFVAIIAILSLFVYFIDFCLPRFYKFFVVLYYNLVDLSSGFLKFSPMPTKFFLSAPYDVFSWIFEGIFVCFFVGFEPFFFLIFYYLSVPLRSGFGGISSGDELSVQTLRSPNSDRNYQSLTQSKKVFPVALVDKSPPAMIARGLMLL